MAVPTLIDTDDFGGASESFVDSKTTKSFTLAAGDFLVVELHVYQSDSGVTPMVVSDSVNGNWTEYANIGIAGGSAVFAVLSSGAGSSAVTINPPGSEALIWGSVQQFRGGTFTSAGDTGFWDADGGAESAFPRTAEVTGLSSGDYLIAGTLFSDFNSGDVTNFVPGVNQTQHHGVTPEEGDFFCNSFDTRAFEGVTAASLTWDADQVSNESITSMGYAAAVFSFSAGGFVPYPRPRGLNGGMTGGMH
jgi:hypothetical protein